MAIGGLPKYLVVDDFLPADLLNGLLDHALAQEADYVPSELNRDVGSRLDLDVRQSLYCNTGLGPLKQPLRALITARFDELCAAINTPAFPISRIELQLISHGDGAFYLSHIDTHTGPNHLVEEDYRVVTCVYYFHREPKAFSGGEIVLFALGDSKEQAVIEPVQNRLLVFPSFVPHEVRKISCPSGAFADSRFSINCWIRKEKRKIAAG